MDFGLALAAIVLSTISILSNVALFAYFLGKYVFSSHIIEYKPLEEIQTLKSHLTSGGKPLADPYAEIGQPLSDDEMEYFKKQQAVQ